MGEENQPHPQVVSHDLHMRKVDTLGRKWKLLREIAQHFKAVTVTLKCFLNFVIKEINEKISSRRKQTNEQQQEKPELPQQ